jgi:hypothetical protein
MTFREDWSKRVPRVVLPTRNIVVTAEQICSAVDAFGDGIFTDPEGVAVALLWIDAQQVINRARSGRGTVKHMIEQWAGVYVHRTDVNVAARMLGIECDCPAIAIRKRVVLPSRQRLVGVVDSTVSKPYPENCPLMVFYSTVEGTVPTPPRPQNALIGTADNVLGGAA